MSVLDFAHANMVWVYVGVFVAGCLMVWAFWPDESSRKVKRRLQSEVLEVEHTPVMEQMIKALEPYHRGLKMEGYLNWVTNLTEAAGARMPPMHFLIIQEIGGLCGFVIYSVLVGFQKPHIPALIFLVGLGFFLPVMKMHNQFKNRQLTIGRDLPEVVDLLTLCVRAGTDFMGAMTRIIREFRPCPVRDELGIVLSEVRVGKRRRDALKGFAKRLRSPEASTFARTLIQVDRMGTGLAEALTILSEDMRLNRYHWADRFAQQAPLKMLLPLILGMSASMIVVGGPIIIRFFRGGLMTPPTAESMAAGAHQQ